MTALYERPVGPRPTHLRVCARTWCFNVLPRKPRPDGYCSDDCSRINCLIPAANGLVGPEPATKPTPTCPDCGQEIRYAIVNSGGRVRVDPEPRRDGQYVLNGGRVVAVLGMKERTRKDWAGGLYAAHHCVSAA